MDAAGRRSRASLYGRGKLHDVEGPDGEVERQYAHEHEGAAQEGEDQELHCGVLSPSTAPLGDEEVHWQELQFPEYEEQNQVHGHEHSHDRGLEYQQPHEVLLDLVPDAVPGSENGAHAQKGRQEHHGHAQAVHAKVVLDVQGGNPVLVALHQLHVPFPGVVARPEHDESDDRKG